MGTAYRRTSGHCQRCFAPIVGGQTVVMVREHLIYEELAGGRCICTEEWVAVCSACAKPAERAAATKEDFCRACMQQVMRPPEWRVRVTVCSNRCAQRYRRRQKSDRRLSLPCSECGTRFRPNRSDARYCSAACRQRAYRDRGGPAFNPDPLEVTFVLDKLRRIT